MKSIMVLGTMSWASGNALAAAVAGCAADNCYRAVAGTFQNMQTVHAQDCSRLLACTFMPAMFTSSVTINKIVTQTTTETSTPVAWIESTTITPETSTITSTSTPFPSTSTTTVTPVSTILMTSYTDYVQPVKRSLVNRAASGVLSCPSSVALPNYATTCSAFTRYSSACLCAGVVRATATLSTQTASTTITVTQPISVATTITTTLDRATTTISTTNEALTSTIITAADSPTETITVSAPTSTTTQTTVLPLPTLCGNAGLQWAYYRDFQSTTSEAEDNAFDPAIVKSQTPVDTGTTPYIQYSDAQTVYGKGPYAGTDFIINHRGYFFAPETGAYSVSALAIDNIAYLWINPAVSGWSKNNAEFYVHYQNGPGYTTYPVYLFAGGYYPFRILFKQGPGGANLGFNIKSPSGRHILSSDTSYSPYIVQFTCDGQSYPPFGSET